MNTRAALPAKLPSATCSRCGNAMPSALLRPLKVNPPAFVCSNEAACRKRQRQREASAPAPKGKKS